jgi:hypothetical protein
VKANRAYELIVSRDTSQPAFLADEDSKDRIEVIAIDDGEVVLFWDVTVRGAGQLLRSLRSDLAQLSAEAFIARWEGHDGTSAAPPS